VSRPSAGLIVNPVAGLGGAVGLKGSDGAALQARARSLGAVPHAAERADRVLARLECRTRNVTIVTAPGELGANVAAAHSLPVDVLPLPARAGPTTADDTRAAARGLVNRGVDLILFAGGDGTTRDIHDAVGDAVPVLGIPTGVKMHSGVFATTPESAGDAAAAFLSAGDAALTREGEVVDFDEELEGAIATRLYGALRVPDDPHRVQPMKAATPFVSDEAALAAVCASIADGMDPRRLYIVGPGTTMRRVLERLGLEKTLLGIDVVRAGRLVAADASEQQLLQLLEGEPATLVVGVVGGQGALVGRGNQQLSPAVIRRIGAENVEIVAGLHKLLALDPPVLHVDTGDPALDEQLCGYRRVHVAPGRTLVAKVAA
jgi:predicted polyphosphate/ATP-dependent NAD kinase